MAAPDAEIELLVDLYEEHGTSLHRLAVLLGAETASGHILRTALLSLGRRVNSVVDPMERLEYLQEQVVHQARSARGSGGALTLPDVDDARQQEILAGIRTLPVRDGEVLVISHYLSIFGPELAGILRMTIRSTNARLEEALDRLRLVVGDPTPGSMPGVIESLSQEVTAALRSSARSVQPSGTDTLAAELLTLGDSSKRGVSPWLVAPLVAASLLLGVWLATVTAAGQPSLPPESPSPSPSVSVSPSPTATASRSMPAMVRAVPVFYVGRTDGQLYRELRDLPAGRNLISAALEATLSLAPLDPDYGSAWGPGALISAEVTGDVLTIDLTPEAFEGIDSRARARSAVNQMLYTASELSGNPDLRVKFLSDGGPPPEVLAQPEEGFGRTGLSPMPALWLSSPKNGATLPAGQVVIAGTVKPGADSPLVTITAEDGTLVASVSAQTTTTASAEGWRDWSVVVPLQPGAFIINATTEIVTEDGGAARGYQESKSITVR
ncbi:hypothetical protein GCM10028820_16190 [Tessaracoccus terricola]